MRYCIIYLPLYASYASIYLSLYPSSYATIYLSLYPSLPYCIPRPSSTPRRVIIKLNNQNYYV